MLRLLLDNLFYASKDLIVRALELLRTQNNQVPGSLGLFQVARELSYCTPKRPCTQRVYTLAPKYLYRDYFKAEAYLFGYNVP